MPTLDTCIAGIFTPGSIGADTGEDPTKPIVGSLLDPDNYDPDSVTYSLDGSKFYNSGYIFVTLIW